MSAALQQSEWMEAMNTMERAAARRRHQRRVWVPTWLCFVMTWLVMQAPLEVQAARVKDIAHVQGARENQLMGYGIVVGLDGTGDTGRAALTTQTIASMLGRLNIKIDRKDLRTRNVAAVIVTADLPGFAKSGQKLDVTISSVGDARSLKGGTLLMTPLRGVDGEIYAMAQGPLMVGGVDVQGAGANSKQRNHLNVGRIPDGGSIERSLEGSWSEREELLLNLFEADFTTAVAMADAISAAFEEEKEEPAAAAAANGAPPAQPQQPAVEEEKKGPRQGIARAVDATTIRVEIPKDWQTHTLQFIAMVEQIEVKRDVVARVVVNERTGTVVLGGNVRIRQVAVAHGNLTLSVGTTYEASQPSAFRGQGNTAILPNSEVELDEQPGRLQVIEEGASIGEVVAALNAIGVSPRDLIAILQAIKAAGALDAQIEVQ